MHFNDSAVRAGHAAGDRQAEPGAFGTRGKEGLEQASLRRRIHAAPVVAHPDADIPPHYMSAELNSTASCTCGAPSRRACIEGVFHQIDQDAAQRLAVAADGGAMAKKELTG